ncbi:hypothetical protein FF36_03719 [Frankia torreyi]|uniref:Uncharacterized protein n=1 Tax=Frankia torreyi TaxID=1856 RepID=A0A0D8BCQ0_9ACTN|nr:hypothetical protein FF36_03719 [Frankia torreyi]KQC37093.1 hypothetical protein UK82_17740 [Frankia sp. ACN1ag]KQM04036.1 hypothetical protein FF86_103141 [Frankia sp. CpI1-P]
MGTAFACTGSSSATASTGVIVAPVRDVAAETVAPSARDADAIDKAVRTSPYTAQVPTRNYEVAGTRLASSDPSWAYTELHPTVADLDRAEGVLHRTDGGWKLVQLGTYEVGCGVAPTAVLDDFGLQCPPADATDDLAAADSARPA